MGVVVLERRTTGVSHGTPETWGWWCPNIAYLVSLMVLQRHGGGDARKHSTPSLTHGTPETWGGWCPKIESVVSLMVLQRHGGSGAQKSNPWCFSWYSRDMGVVVPENRTCGVAHGMVLQRHGGLVKS